ncbi:MAG: hypothetical protein RML45_14465 [Acetobacteraceae bacterium]|nr:hypothetical protein [Acetobacteraceae bacterium]
MEGKSDDALAPAEKAEQRIRRRAGRTALAREEFDHHRPRPLGRRAAPRQDGGEDQHDEGEARHGGDNRGGGGVGQGKAA